MMMYLTKIIYSYTDRLSRTLVHAFVNKLFGFFKFPFSAQIRVNSIRFTIKKT